MATTYQTPLKLSWRRAYILTYTTISTVLWMHILLSLVLSAQPHYYIYPNIEPVARWTQVLGVLDILHAATGMTKTPTHIAVVHVLMRLAHLWGINYKLSGSTTFSPQYTLVLYAWSVDNVLVYGYSLLRWHGVTVPRPLRWIRYSSVFLLGPLGYMNAWAMMRDLSSRVASELSVRAIIYYGWLVYIPGGLVVQTHRIKVRQEKLYPS